MQMMIDDNPTEIECAIRMGKAYRLQAELLRMTQDRLTVAVAQIEELRATAEEARILVSNCVGKWHDMVDELWQLDPESYIFAGEKDTQIEIDHRLRRVEIALTALRNRARI